MENIEKNFLEGEKKDFVFFWLVQFARDIIITTAHLLKW